MLPNLTDLSGQVAVVTGAAGGLGALACRTFAAAGADIVLVGRNAARMEGMIPAIETLGRRAVAIAADVTDRASVAAMAEKAASAFGRVDILLNNAGTTSPKDLFSLTDEDWHGVMDTSATGTFLCVQAIAPAMIAAGSGRIINMGSILSLRGMARRVAYAAAKGAVANLTRALAFELGPHGITVNALGPTVIETDLNRELIRTQPELYRAVLDRTPMGRLGQQDDLAGALLFLASPAAGYITGQVLCVDGGYTAG
ncbi:MAG: glucose 1-dehydrogenase [Alphaproteobacteria bacterium]|nr:glucose 1-dehydrogenase [Alphaproteobacteria bacterium]